MQEQKGNNFQDFTSRESRFFSRLISRERYNTSKQHQQPNGDSSFRVLYYGGATSSVPFLWESQPGTPKHTSNDSPLPPLTPPPSYQLSPQRTMNSKNPTHKINSKNSKFFNSIFPRAMSSKKINAASPVFNSPSSSNYSSSSGSSFSSYSAPSTPRNSRKGSIKVRSRSTVKCRLVDEFNNDGGRSNSPTSTLCFGTPRLRGYANYPVKSVKKVVLSIVGGHGTG